MDQALVQKSIDYFSQVSNLLRPDSLFPSGKKTDPLMYRTMGRKLPEFQVRIKNSNRRVNGRKQQVSESSSAHRLIDQNSHI